MAGRSVARRLRMWPAVLCSVLLSAAATGCTERPRRPLLLVAASFADAAARVVGDAATVVPAATSTHARRIVQGAPADVFVSADLEWMDYVERHRRTAPGTRQDLVHNEVVLVAPVGHRPFDLGGFCGRIAMGDPSHVPAGRYGRQALERAGVWERVAKGLVPTRDVRHALVLVERGEVDVGVVYATDARRSGRVEVVHRFARAPEVVYQVARIAGGDPDLLRRLTDSRARAIYRDLGFLVPDR